MPPSEYTRLKPAHVHKVATVSGTCVGVGLVNGGHTLFGRNAQVVYQLQVREEVEGVRQEVREVKDEENGEINGEGEPHTS